MVETTINNGQTMGGANGTLLAGRYRVVRQLGQGGMGSVWLAEDIKLDGFKVAIKMLPSVLVNNKRAYQQVKAEALVSLKLSHPNIATVRAFEEENGNPFLVMDYIDGQTLDDYLADKGKLSEDETVKLLKPVAAALDYAHAQGVVHRDVKPGNVMIRKDGTPFVLDFGIAREIQETMTRVTGKLSSGTLLYMSPEQLNGDAPKPAQDIYSFAAMAYECLKGEPPFSRGQIEYQIVNNKPEPLDPQFANCGLGVMAGLAKSPETRPTTCTAVLELDDNDARTVRRKVKEAIAPTERQNDWLSKIDRIILTKYKLCEFWSIPIYIANSFSILLLLAFLVGFTEPKSFASDIAALLGLSIAVAWHKFGYVAIMRAFGYRAKDITLSMFSGCANFVSLPLKTWQKIVVPLAWLLVNLALSWVTLFVWFIFCCNIFDPDPVTNTRYEAIGLVIFMNLIVFAFNLLPGLPMDGGHILWAFLLKFVSRPKAALIAMWVGRALVVLLVFCFIFSDLCVDWKVGIFAIFISWMAWKDSYLACQQIEKVS